MKNTKIILLMLLSLLLVPTIFAHEYRENKRYENYLDTNDGIIYIITDHSYFYDRQQENENRYPTYDYRHGYTYRITEEYSQNKYTKNYEDYPYSYRQMRYLEAPNHYYLYNENIDKYEQHECYNYPPKNKFLYIKCP